jgi:glycogen(starch) synthase
MKVLHVFDHFLPLVDGYTIRSSSIVVAQHRLGMQPSVAVSPLQPSKWAAPAHDFLDKIPIRRTVLAGGLKNALLQKRIPVLREITVINSLAQTIDAAAQEFGVELIHAHSPALNGLAAARVAARRKLPFVYEIRAFWEDAAADQGKGSIGSPRYKAVRSLETSVVKRADAVIGIADYILRDVEARGVLRERLFHVPNGVDTTKFVPRSADAELLRKHNPNGEVLFGFIGSFFKFEGVPWVVRALAELRKCVQGFRAVLIGDGEDFAAAKQAIAEAGAADYIFAIGRVPHDDIQRYYSIMDVMLYPRHSIRLTELVTALKPLEALAQSKAVLASGVAAMHELIKPEVTGLLHKPDDIADFCRQAERLIKDASLRKRLGEAGRITMLEEKEWSVVGKRYENIYQRALQHARSKA